MSAQDAVFVCRVSDLALRDGEWPVIGRLAGWSVEQWPMPQFLIPPRRSGEPSREETYYEHDPGHLKRSMTVSDPTTARRLPDGATFGARLAAERLTAICEQRRPPATGRETPLFSGLVA